MHELFDLVLSETRAALTAVSDAEAELLLNAVAKAERVFVCGGGRSGLIVRAFAMRLMHVGLRVHVVGETTTPAIAEGDLLVACSASGATESTIVMAKRAAEARAKVAAVTSAPRSDLARMADLVVHVPSPTKNDHTVPSQQFGSTLFEQAALLFFDALCLAIQKGVGEDPKRMMKRHSNLE